MFRNRALQVSMVKKDEDGNSIPPPVETQADVIAFASDSVKDVMQEATRCIIVFLVVKTVAKTASEVVINLTK